MPAITEESISLTLEVHQRLSQVYGSGIKYFHDLDPLSELVSSFLSHRTKNKLSAIAYYKLKEVFGSWEAVRDAPTDQVQAAIKTCTWPEQKAPRLQEVLRRVTELNHGNLTVDFLKDMPVKEARTWLEELPGVGPKTSAAVISFSNMRGKALPVDSHHYRVAVRLGMIDKKIGEGKANYVLESMLPEYFTAQDVYDNHQVMMKHGQKICTYLKPLCEDCVLLDICPTGKLILEEKKQEQTED